MKEKIRKEILSLRNEFETNSSIIQSVIDNFYQFIKKPKIIAGYYPTGSELNITPLLNSLKNHGCTIALPVINQNNILDFYEWQDALEPSKMYKKILEPREKQKPILPDLIIAPLIACDYLGNRIGSGKGMYDKTISLLRSKRHNFFYIGICFDFQLLEQIPAEEHDQKLDFIVTDKRIIEVS